MQTESKARLRTGIKEVKQETVVAVVNSIIGEGARFRGDFELSGLLRIDGDFEGSIESAGKVLVGRHGSAIVPSINARVVIVGGKVIGNICAQEMVTILSTGTVEGDIETPRLLAEEGVTINGRITTKSEQKKGAQDPALIQKEIELARQELDSIPAQPEQD
jgi:cytoskeletal protein CcmA (bactofilin family)